jgi:hypothetical protein
MHNKKAPGDDGINGEILNKLLKFSPRFIAAMYNGCLRSGVFQRGGKEQN